MKVSSRQMPERDREILGAPKYSSLDDVPICKGNSRICNFISCTAHNFKNDQSFANINLATQVLADTKLRKAISKLDFFFTLYCIVITFTLYCNCNYFVLQFMSAFLSAFSSNFAYSSTHNKYIKSCF